MTWTNRTKLIAAIVVAAPVFGVASNPAAACNRIDGCGREAMVEGQQMMRDTRNDEAMRQGRDNIEAFRALQRAEEAYRQRPAPR